MRASKGSTARHAGLAEALAWLMAPGADAALAGDAAVPVASAT